MRGVVRACASSRMRWAVEGWLLVDVVDVEGEVVEEAEEAGAVEGRKRQVCRWSGQERQQGQQSS